MPVTVSVSPDFVSQDVQPPSSTPYFNVVDLDIPSGAQVVGAGALVTSYWDGAQWAPIDTAGGSGASFVESLRVLNGPHPTDTTKWRFTISQSGQSWRITVRVWIAAL